MKSTTTPSTSTQCEKIWCLFWLILIFVNLSLFCFSISAAIYYHNDGKCNLQVIKNVPNGTSIILKDYWFYGVYCIREFELYLPHSVEIWYWGDSNYSKSMNTVYYDDQIDLYFKGCPVMFTNCFMKYLAYSYLILLANLANTLIVFIVGLVFLFIISVIVGLLIFLLICIYKTCKSICLPPQEEVDTEIAIKE